MNRFIVSVSDVEKLYDVGNWSGVLIAINEMERNCQRPAGQSIARKRWLGYLMCLEILAQKAQLPHNHAELLFDAAYYELRTGFIEVVEDRAIRIRVWIEESLRQKHGI